MFPLCHGDAVPAYKLPFPGRWMRLRPIRAWITNGWNRRVYSSGFQGIVAYMVLYFFCFFFFFFPADFNPSFLFYLQLYPTLESTLWTIAKKNVSISTRLINYFFKWILRKPPKFRRDKLAKRRFNGSSQGQICHGIGQVPVILSDAFILDVVKSTSDCVSVYKTLTFIDNCCLKIPPTFFLYYYNYY